MDERKKGRLYVVGFGPGSHDHLTPRAREAIADCDVVVGYVTYVNLVRDLLGGKEVIKSGMREEVERAQKAVALAEAGRRVAVISSGDPGIYGMAGLVFEVLREKGWKPGAGVEVEVVPGVTALSAAAALLGAPANHDFASISLSDLLTPWEVIARRIEGAALGDFVVALYNPASGRRTRQVVEAQRIILKYRSPDTPVGIVKSAFRDQQTVVLTTLGGMLKHEVGMLTTILIGSSSTFVHEGRMVTPRGYAGKYELRPEGTESEEAHASPGH